MKRLLAVATVVAAALVPATRAAADIVLSTGAVTYGARGETTDILISALNNGAEDAFLSYLELGLQILPDGAPGGTADITAIGLPASNSAWDNATASTAGPAATVLTGTTPINGSSDYWSMSIAAGTDPDTFLPLNGWIPAGQSRNLAVVTVAWTGDATDTASYTWKLYAANEYPAAPPVTYMYDENFNTVQFSNLLVAPESDGTASATVAFITVVPEPTGFVLATTLSVGAFAFARRRFARRR